MTQLVSETLVAHRPCSLKTKTRNHRAMITTRARTKLRSSYDDSVKAAAAMDLTQPAPIHREEFQHAALTLALAITNSLTATFDIDRLAEKVRNTRVIDGDPDNMAHDHLAKFFLIKALGPIDCPSTIVDEHGRVILWYLPDIIAPFRVAAFNEGVKGVRDPLQSSVQELAGKDKCSAWRFDHFQPPTGGDDFGSGCLNLSPGWFQQGHECQEFHQRIPGSNKLILTTGIWMLKYDPIYTDLIQDDNKLVAGWIPDGDGMVAIHLIGYMDQERVDADMALGEKPKYYIGEDEWTGDQLEDDPEEAADQVSAAVSTTEHNIFWGSSPLSPDVKQEIREVSWHPTTPDPNNLTPYASSEPELQYPETDEEVDQLDHASNSSGATYVRAGHRARQAQGRYICALTLQKRRTAREYRSQITPIRAPCLPCSLALLPHGLLPSRHTTHPPNGACTLSKERERMDGG
ncbi:hypothetical protein FIBSPDRAFT_881510 [Athelia psychrophila]|uniref:Uncharacterized protein n=1 Tax=Athelia psychrophila TaxID=1759441 RepID=A0A166WS89_9AGAM|nr:hypothetical protein FIBSPDRAFT_881510 [Fibularhizoctonia sp. CBS 109695]